MKLELSTDDLRPLVEEALGRSVVEVVRALALVSTETACEMLAVSKGSFLRLAEAAGVKPCSLGPRMTRWRVADVERMVGPRVEGRGTRVEKGGGR